MRPGAIREGIAVFLLSVVAVAAATLAWTYFGDMGYDRWNGSSSGEFGTVVYVVTVVAVISVGNLATGSRWALVPLGLYLGVVSMFGIFGSLFLLFANFWSGTAGPWWGLPAFLVMVTATFGPPVWLALQRPRSSRLRLFDAAALALSAIILIFALVPFEKLRIELMSESERHAEAVRVFGDLYLEARKVLSECEALGERVGRWPRPVISSGLNRIHTSERGASAVLTFDLPDTRGFEWVRIEISKERTVSGGEVRFSPGALTASGEYSVLLMPSDGGPVRVGCPAP